MLIDLHLLIRRAIENLLKNLMSLKGTSSFQLLKYKTCSLQVSGISWLCCYVSSLLLIIRAPRFSFIKWEKEKRTAVGVQSGWFRDNHELLLVGFQAIKHCFLMGNRKWIIMVTRANISIWWPACLPACLWFLSWLSPSFLWATPRQTEHCKGLQWIRE